MDGVNWDIFLDIIYELAAQESPHMMRLALSCKDLQKVFMTAQSTSKYYRDAFPSTLCPKTSISLPTEKFKRFLTLHYCMGTLDKIRLDIVAYKFRIYKKIWVKAPIKVLEFKSLKIDRILTNDTTVVMCDHNTFIMCYDTNNFKFLRTELPFGKARSDITWFSSALIVIAYYKENETDCPYVFSISYNKVTNAPV
jgi:hypothetical protein